MLLLHLIILFSFIKQVRGLLSEVFIIKIAQKTSEMVHRNKAEKALKSKIKFQGVRTRKIMHNVIEIFELIFTFYTKLD